MTALTYESATYAVPARLSPARRYWRETALLVGFAAPGDLDVEWVDGLIAGMREECGEVGAAVVGGRAGRDGRRGLGHPVELRDVDVREALQDAPLELGRDRRCGVLDVDEAGEVGGVQVRVVEQHPQHGRDQDEVGDLVVLDRLQDRGGVEARHDDLVRADPRRRDEVRRAILGGLPTLGICLGMQLFFASSDDGVGRGLGVFDGRVV